MAKDKDALTTGQVSGIQAPRKSKATDKDIDDVVDQLFGLTMETKQCDVCLTKLSAKEMTSGSARCTECDENLEKQKKSKKEKKRRHKHHSSTKVESFKPSSRSDRNKRVVVDSDDEEETAEWLVSEDQRGNHSLGVAGGSDDENAEGGGESLCSDDSGTEDESEEKNDPASQSSTEDEDDSEDEDSSDSDNPIHKPSVTSSAKIRHLIKILRKETDDHKIIVFSQFTSMLDLIEPFLRKNHFKFTRYDGKMRNDAREASLNLLRNDISVRVLLCSLKCGSLGLNLTAASRVVIMEPFWNPFVEEQAIDRVHRLNQTVDVTIYKLTVANTVEARILELQDKKRQLAKQAIEGGGKAAAGKLSMKDILNLFRRDAEHEHDHHDRHHDWRRDGAGGKESDLGMGMGMKGNLLGRGGNFEDRSLGGRGSHQHGIMEKGGVMGPRRDEGIFGRRW
ncbi:MAG: hypothetical protein Q9178_002890 [Gyalolechia marmorata]